MNAYLKRLLESGHVVCPDGTTRELHSNTSLGQCEFLQATIRRTGAVSCLEIGLAYGVSAIAISEAASEKPGATLTTVDPFQQQAWSNLGRLNIERAGYSGMVTHVEEMSQLALPRLLGDGSRFDFVYVDTTKIFDAVLVDAFFATRLLRPGGIVVFDDCSWPGIRKVVRFLAEWPHLKVFDTYQPRIGRPNREIARRIAGLLPGSRTLFRPEITRNDEVLGIAAECVAFIKTGDDERPWDWSIVP